jgi:16S rRNA (adenine1518-N6/adenine1519-N6)-dimethyltransferase
VSGHPGVGLPDLPPLRDVIAEYGLAADKRLGQHFLLDANLTGRIARAAGDLTGATVIEIGPGPGGLTRSLLGTAAARIIAVERDPRCVAALQPLVHASSGRLEIVEADALEVDAPSLAGPGPCHVISNLPYNVGTPLLIGWLQAMPRFDSLVLMFQKEVADRVTADVGGSLYGRLAVMSQWLCRAERLFTVDRRAFTPPPKVMSAVVRLTPRPDAAPVSWRAMETVTKAAFGKRRKMLRQSLKGVVAAETLEALGLDPTRRAETLTIEDFVAVARAYERGTG